ncbi:hypothetical protein A3SI_10294 [Nitritalea halalkaliphila LW7]|uniref:DUF177 domain-containing protein n=1 Tax=Nitritalea halalkaliphila LW7 TaxID=1189621 RepID=I5C3K5_9BACT|nr:DUF177 domain-containing protein [Nitritalea halalkaliphila]EIM76407.1 hypothetical protein A3SI_10294 [Nitritalea halalkaliphila LW7]
MRYEANFEIDIIRLKEGEHTFTFTLDDAFIAHHGLEGWAEHMNIHVDLQLLKSSTLLEARFTLKGVVTLVCDRSLEPFEESYSTTGRMHYKYGPEERELDDEVYLITKDTPKLSFVDLLKEFFLLGLPAKKIHPSALGMRWTRKISREKEKWCITRTPTRRMPMRSWKQKPPKHLTKMRRTPTPAGRY